MSARHIVTLLCAAALAGRAAPPSAEEAIARWIDPPAPYAASEGARSLPVALGLFGAGAETGSPEDDVSLLRLGLVADHHNVGVLDLCLLYGHTGGRQRGLQIGAANVVEGPLDGVQIGLLASVSGVLAQSPSTGAQAALLANYSDSLDGLQLALGFNRAGAGSGLQIAAGANGSDRFRGIQIAAVNIDGKEIRGAQIGAINAGAETFSGLQIGAINGCSGTFSGLQAGLLNTATALDGVQFGLFNFASTSRGWQIGLYNDAHHAQGVQIGLANWSSDADYPLLPLVRVAF